MAIIGPHPNHVALIGNDINQGVLPVKTTYRGICFADGLSRFDGKAEWERIRKLKADNGMRDPWRTPIINRHVHACDLRKTNNARLPTRSEIGVGAVIAISYVVKRNLVAVDVGPCRLR